MTTPALLRLREANPATHITLLTHEKLADLWTNHPAVDAVLIFSSRGGVWSVAQNIRSGNFNIGLALPNSHRSALELWLAGIPRRIGCARPWRNWLLTQRVQPRRGIGNMRKRRVNENKRLVSLKPREGIAASLHGPQPPPGHQL